MDRFRLDDPDAAEKAAKIWAKAGGYDWPSEPEVQKWQVVLDAIEQPRLPTRSEVASLVKVLHEADGQLGLVVCRGAEQPPGDAWKQGARHLIIKIRSTIKMVEGWATEDPEPEVDPAQVEALAKLLAETLHEPPGYAKKAAELLLASGRVQVTPQ